jgi:hypothetical protein
MNTPLAKLIAEMVKEKTSYGWDQHTKYMLDDLIEYARLLMDQERLNIIEAYCTGENDGVYSFQRAAEYYKSKHLTNDTENVKG